MSPERISFEQWWAHKNGMFPERLKEGFWLAFGDGWYRASKERAKIIEALEDAASDFDGLYHDSFDNLIGCNFPSHAREQAQSAARHIRALLEKINVD